MRGKEQFFKNHQSANGIWSPSIEYFSSAQGVTQMTRRWALTGEGAALGWARSGQKAFLEAKMLKPSF